MKQWRHISLKYLRYEHLVVVLRCLPSEEAVGLANLKKKLEGKVGEIFKNITFCLFSMGPKCMKYQEIKKSN